MARAAAKSVKAPNLTQALPVAVKARVICQYMDVGERRVQELAQEGIIERPTAAGYPFQESVARYIRYLRAAAANQGSKSLQEEKTRLAAAQADKIEHDLAKAKGEVIETEQVVEAWGKMITVARTRMLGMPTALAPMLLACETVVEVKEMLEQSIYDILADLATDGTTIPDDEEEPLE